jgi:thiamine biosynthesis lipoprotein
MGVQTRIVEFAPDKARAESAAAAAFERIDQLDQMMSDYRRGSELNRLSDAAGGAAVRVSPELFEVLATAQDIALASDGAFDVTVGPEVALWRAARVSGRLPDEGQLARARALVGWQGLELHRAARTARLKHAGMRLDLGGIAKGYAAEQAALVLEARGVRRCLVALSGDVYATDPPPGERGWRIEVRDEQGGGGSGTILLRRAAVSTAGDTEQFIEVDGKRYSHVIDPRTGLGLQLRRSVTVVAPHGAWADGLDDAACINGPEATAWMLRQYPKTGAVFQDAGERGVVQTVIDPGGVLVWAVAGGGAGR